MPTEPFDWRDDKTAWADLKENMNRIIKAAAAAALAPPAAGLRNRGEQPGAAMDETETPAKKPDAAGQP